MPDPRLLPRACRACEGTLSTVLDLGTLYVSAFPRPEDPDGLAAPLDLCRCDRCGLVQLRHSVPVQDLYCTYWYRSGVNEVMRAELADVVRAASAWVDLQAGDTVVDIGANDGTLLAQYDPIHHHRIAFEPADNLLPLLQPHADVIVHGCFPTGDPACRDAKIVTSIACYYDTDDPVGWAAAVAAILHQNGVWVIQAQDLQQMIERNAWDNLCHEHVWQPCLAAVERMVQKVGLAVTYAERRAINGGSLRIFVQHRWKARQQSWDAREAVRTLLQQEHDCEGRVALAAFAARVKTNQAQIREVLEDRARRGQTVDLYAASTKANTLLQACGLKPPLLRRAWERSPEKWGRVTVGTRIPLVAEAIGRQDPPDALFVGAWQFVEAFRVREADFLRKGGQLIVPLPEVRIYED